MKNRLILAIVLVSWVLYVVAMTYGMDHLKPATFMRIVLLSHPAIVTLALLTVINKLNKQ